MKEFALGFAMKFLLNEMFDVISYFAAVFTVIGAFFLVRSILESGAREIAAMSGTYIGSNPHLEAALVKQKADSLIGFSITLIGGLLWLVTVFCAATIDLSMNSVGTLFLATVLLTLLCFYLSKKIFKSLYIQTRVISFCHHVEGYLRNNGAKFDPKKLVEDAKRLGLKDLVKDGTDSYDTIAAILQRGGASPGADFVKELKVKNRAGGNEA